MLLLCAPLPHVFCFYEHITSFQNWYCIQINFLFFKDPKRAAKVKPVHFVLVWLCFCPRVCNFSPQTADRLCESAAKPWQLRKAGRFVRTCPAHSPLSEFVSYTDLREPGRSLSSPLTVLSHTHRRKINEQILQTDRRLQELKLKADCFVCRTRY